MFVENIKSGQVTSSEKRWVSGELGAVRVLGEMTRSCVTLKAVTYSQSRQESWQDVEAWELLQEQGLLQQHGGSLKTDSSWARWPQSKWSPWTQTLQSWAGAGRVLSRCKVLLLPVCCTGMLLISWREFREDQERGGLHNVLCNKTQHRVK